MSESRTRKYRLLIVPGGNFEDIGNSLTSRTAANIRNAIQHWLELFRNLRGRFLCRPLAVQRLESYLGDAVRVLCRRSAGCPESSGCDYRCRRTDVRSVLGGWPAAYRLGCGCRQVSRPNPRHRGGGIRERMGDSHGGSPRGSGELAARNGLQNASRYRQCVRGDTDARRLESRVATALLT